MNWAVKFEGCCMGIGKTLSTVDFKLKPILPKNKDFFCNFINTVLYFTTGCDDTKGARSLRVVRRHNAQV